MRGNLETISLAELCMQLSGQGMSGTLTLDSSEGEGQLSFKDGNIVWARSPSRSARIGDRLVHSGLLDPYYVDQAAQAQRDAPPGTGIAALLVDRGLVSADAARVFLQEQMLNAVTEMLAWRDGDFELSTEPPPVLRLEVSVQTQRLLTEVRRRLAEQETIRQVVHDLDLVPATTLTRPDDLALDEEAVLRAIDGETTIRELGDALGFSDNEIRRIIYGLTVIDAVDLSGQGRSAGGPMDESETAIADALDDVLTRLTGEEASEPEAQIMPTEPEPVTPEPEPAEVPVEPEAAPATSETTPQEREVAQDEHEVAAEADAAPHGFGVMERDTTTEQDTAEQDTAGLDVDEPAAEPEVTEPGVVESGAREPEMDEPEMDEPAGQQRRSAIGDPTAVHDDEPRPWVGYAKATSPPPAAASAASEQHPPAAPTEGDAATWDVPSTPLVARSGPGAAPPSSGDRKPSDKDRTGAPAASGDHRTRSEAASWLAAVSDAAEPASEAEPEPSPPPPSPAPPEVEEPSPDEPAPRDAEDSVDDDAPSAPPPSGDDLSALLAELSSLSTEDEGDDRAAPPPRKPSSDSDSSGDGKDGKRKRLFGR